MTAESYRGLAIEFAKRGFAALLALRRGAGARDRNDIRLPGALPAPPQLGESGKAIFLEYASHAPHEAFAGAPDGAFGWRSKRPTAVDASRDAMQACLQYSEDCSLDAVDDPRAR
jgi:hypothetical protein